CCACSQSSLRSLVLSSGSLSFFVFSWCLDLLVLLSFPTRRSSDLRFHFLHLHHRYQSLRKPVPMHLNLLYYRLVSTILHGMCHRSEEHTSELQSRFDLVCRLLLEKKKELAQDLDLGGDADVMIHAS